MSSCFQWGSRNFDNYPQETALDKTYNYSGKVIIIGAGASGLAAAKILERNNIDYQIIEATNRYGGRLKKNETLADFPIDVGAEWIHNLPPILNRLKGKEGDEVDEELIPYHLEKAYSWNGKKYKEISKVQRNAMFKFMPEYKFKNSTWYDFIDKNFAQEVKHKIIFNAPVTEINYSNDKVQVKTQNGTMYIADKVLVTVSIGVLKSNYIKFEPALNEEKQEAIESIGFLPGFKLVMKFSEKFYPNVINCKVETGEKAYYDIAFKKEAQSHIFGLLVTGESAEEYYQLSSNEAIVEAALKELDEIFDGKASETYTDEYILENWGQHEFTLGTWTLAFESKQSIIETLNVPLDKKVYFAGEIYDVHKQLGVPGAILSGYHSIDRLLLGKK
ncbi:MAG: NAD(P)/FAD-dependent oxidoreductase [Saprospiraceae bacterium]